MTSKSPCFPDHIIQGMPGEPERVLYIFDSCRMGLLRGTVGWSLMATSFPATVCVPRYTEPVMGLVFQGRERENVNWRTTTAVCDCFFDSVLATEGVLHGLRV